ncbi:unnamed protein product [Coffea canephora]|uniref:Hexosyltransferase n=1 Tax=Coffea canephora TaxID=49390 RepID=A0A068U878_COFCA|nr:unnamed protein product [Coffea canephora]
MPTFISVEYLDCKYYNGLIMQFNSVSDTLVECPEDQVFTYPEFQLREDVYKRKLQRIRVKDVEKSLQIPLQQQSIKYRHHLLKFIVLVILLGILLAIFISSTICPQQRISDAVSQLLWSKSDPRYISNLDISWNEISRVLEHVPGKNTVPGVGLLNFNSSEITHWKQLLPDSNHTILHLDHADQNVTWNSFYPEWIDQEQEYEVPSCPSLPQIEVPGSRLDLIAVNLPCRNEQNWNRDVARLHLQLAVAGLATFAKGNFPVYVLFITNCFPIPNLFTCKELIARQGNAWLFKPNLNQLREKLHLPKGSCELALPLGDAGKTEQDCSVKKNREAYATVLLSAHLYVCGAIAAAQSVRMAGSTRDLVILVDETISEYHKSGLQMAGWKVRTILRIRNPKAEKYAYNAWNYSKFRLWQLTDYDKIIFIDSDLLIRRNIDFLFSMPEISARGNNGVLFNSGVMVIEPSNCTFQLLMDHITDIESYNGGDQGYLNEVFTWWHRIPNHFNFLKNFLSYEGEEVNEKKIRLIAAEPPVLYVIHYLGYKPWMCSRDYDCNWNVGKLHEFASDDAHGSWWEVHDAMPEKLQDFCKLKSKQKAQLNYDRREAEKRNYTDGHWKIKIKDPRFMKCSDDLCDFDFESRLWRWGEIE